MTGRGRGRAGRGRGRGKPPSQPEGRDQIPGFGCGNPQPQAQVSSTSQPQDAPKLSAWRTPIQIQPGQASSPRQPGPRMPGPRQPYHSGQGDRGDDHQQASGTGRASYRRESGKTPRGKDKLARQFGRLSVQTPDEKVKCRPEHLSDKQGNSGRKLELSCNYFDILAMPTFSLHHYHVNFAPDIDGKRVKKALLLQHAEKYFGHLHLFDGMMLFLPRKLPDSLELFSYSDATDVKYKITITWRCKIMQTSPTIIQLLNILYKQMLSSLELVQIGRNYYSIPNEIPKDNKLAQHHNLTVFDGIQSSILNYERGAMLCVDISHKVMRTDTVADLMRNHPVSMNSPQWKDGIMKRLLGKIVLTRYNNRTYRIDDIDINVTPTKTFLKHNEPISFVDYYKTNYGIAIRYTNLPMLLSKPKARDIRGGQKTPIFLVPELVVITGIDDEVRTNFELMQDLAHTTRLTPEARVDRLQQFIHKTRNNKEAMELVEKWQLQLAENLAKVTGRVLAPETIQFHGKTAQYQESNADWSGSLRDSNLVTTIAVDNWLLIYPRFYAKIATDFEACLQRVAQPLGIKYSKAQRCELRDNDPSGQSYIGIIKEQVTDSTKMVVAVVHDMAKNRYDAIKKFCSIDQPAGKPIPSQVVVQKSLTKKNTFMSVATKIAIQINCKLGGIPWRIHLPLNNFMIVGIDHYHDSAKKGHSVGGIVASMNPEMTQWYSRTTFQTPHEELSSKLHIVTQMLLKRYREINRRLPDRVFIYRDGVGDGQLNVLLNYEVKQYTEAFKSLAPDHVFKMSVIVVKKRINTRLFAPTGNSNRRDPQWKNPVSGSIVDTDIVRNEWYDYFIVSQSVRQGTVSPTHYNVIYDSSGLKPDHLQKLTYKMCHLYYNWPGTIRVPAPCQYAHKLAFLVGQSIHKEPAMVLRDKLFYL